MADQTPPTIRVWVCTKCGYWRQEKSSGVHQVFPDNGPGVAHELVEAIYIFEGEVER